MNKKSSTNLNNDTKNTNINYEKYINPDIYKSNSQVSYPPSSNSFSETEFNSSIRSSAVFSNTSPYSQILPSPSYFSVASTSTNDSQCSYRSNPSLALLGNNFIPNSPKFENKMLSMKKNFNHVQMQIESILAKTYSYIPIFQVSIAALILIERMKNIRSDVILKQILKTHISLNDNKGSEENQEPVIIDSILSTMKTNKNIKEEMMCVNYQQ
jgi:hypothetical protein